MEVAIVLSSVVRESSRVTIYVTAMLVPVDFFKAFTYQAGLSGGAWLLSSLAGNNYPTISSLRDDLWIEAFRDSLLLPTFLTSAVGYGQVTNDVVAKDRAGFPPTLTGPWGRLLSYQLLFGLNGGVF